MLTVIEGYEPKNIYNADEWRLFIRFPCNKTLSYKGDPRNGANNFEETISVLFACTAQGADRLSA
jgi:hypothetical protein